MAVCVKCGQEIGFFSVKRNVGVVSPLCKACHGPLVENITQLVLKYGEQEETAKSTPGDLKARAWMAVANLLCAERVNLLLETLVGVTESPIREETWSVSREKAIANAKVALEHVAEGS